jgi:hypothetical protein
VLKNLSSAATIAVFSGLGFTSASALPLGPAMQASAAEQTISSDLILVAQGCGIGFHRGPWGGCRPNVSPYWPCYWVRTPWGPRRVCH